ncbi:unnamed protein product [Hermetia illucens]|uniref:Large ribosomal subunit protein bL32m n=1 Tax=Hermetia illucens TaxID=343691 RepID=A0A7R8UBL5_HERIL|nr:39S ribosomal protein L32, mitochondrial [Hermetia illucens]CAD7077551.1 unnamed protein product [Hermetia illucens]
MSNYLSIQAVRLLQRIDRFCASILSRNFPPPDAYCLPAVQNSPLSGVVNGANKPQRTLREIWSDAILWAVPKHRRTVEKRLKRKYGRPDQFWKMLKVNWNIRTCNNCGKDYEAGTLCPHCYEKVKKETEEIQTKIQEELKLDPVEKDVVILYDGEKDDRPEIVNGKRIVEMKKPRPMWFSKNLIQKSTQQNTANKPIKPDDLV